MTEWAWGVTGAVGEVTQGEVYKGRDGLRTEAGALDLSAWPCLLVVNPGKEVLS